MKNCLRLFLIIASLASVVGLNWLLSDNRQLKSQIDQLEAELGRMSIDEPDRVSVVEIDRPDVPSEVAAELERIWQFRCYFPPGYDFLRFSGSGRVAEEGLYVDGGSGSGWGSPNPEATQQLLTVSLQRGDKRWEAFYSLGGSSGTTSWGSFIPDRFDNTVIVQKLVSREGGPRSFEPDVILPLLKIFDSATPKAKAVAGKQLTTYSGGLFVLCPKSRESQLRELVQGKTPVHFDPSWIAGESGDE